MSVEEENALKDEADKEAEGGVIILPHFDYNTKAKGLSGCSACPSKPKHEGSD